MILLKFLWDQNLEGQKLRGSRRLVFYILCTRKDFNGPKGNEIKKIAWKNRSSCQTTEHVLAIKTREIKKQSEVLRLSELHRFAPSGQNKIMSAKLK